MLKCKQTEVLKIEHAGKNLLSQWLLQSSVVERWEKRERKKKGEGGERGRSKGGRKRGGDGGGEREGGGGRGRGRKAHRLGDWVEPWAVAPSSGTKLKPRRTGDMAHCKEPNVLKQWKPDQGPKE